MIREALLSTAWLLGPVWQFAGLLALAGWIRGQR